MKIFKEWKAPFLVNSGAASTGHHTNPQVVGLFNGWFLIAWAEQFGDGAPGNDSDIVGKIYNADGVVVYDSDILNYEWVVGKQFAFDVAPSHDGFLHVYFDSDFPDDTVRIERTFEDESYLFAWLFNSGSFESPNIAANLLSDNDDIFIVFENTSAGSLDAVVIDENDSFSSVFPVLAPGTVADRLRGDDATILSNGNFATLLWNGGANYVSIVGPDGTFLSQTLIATSATPTEFARDLASLAGGGIVVVGVTI